MGATGIETPSVTPESAPNPAKPSESDPPNGPAAGVGGDSSGPGADLARAIMLAAEAGEWAVVSQLARQLDLLAAKQGRDALRILPGGRG